MSVKQQVTHERQLYYSVPLVAKLLGTSATKVRRLMLAEGLEWMNFRENGPIYISVPSSGVIPISRLVASGRLRLESVAGSVWNTQPKGPAQGIAAVPSNPREGVPPAPPSPATTQQAALDAEDGDLPPDVFAQVRAVVFGKPKSGIPVG